MTCYHPLDAYRLDGGGITFNSNAKGVGSGLKIPCGQCIGCRQRRAQDWAIRCVHESQMHLDNCFITLTYDDEHLPEDYGLNHRHFQLFFKRLRKRFSPIKPRYYMCGEYGDLSGRPHYHACLFGLDFDDRILYSQRDNINLYTSRTLDNLWGLGMCTIGDVTYESAAYITRYINKRITGHMAKIAYSHTDPDTGEIITVSPEYNKMSLKPGIGSGWLDKYKSDVFPRDHVQLGHRKLPVPRYYNNKIIDSASDNDKFNLAENEILRFEKALNNAHDHTPERLSVREQVMKARHSSLIRPLE